MSTESFKEFLTHIRSVGLPTGSHFYVEFLGRGGDARTVGMLVDQVAIPGLSILSAEYRTFGEVTESAYGISYAPVNISTIVDNNSSASLFFYDWADDVFDTQTRTIGYYNDYVSDVRVVLLNKMGDPIFQVVLKEAYPKAVAEVSLDYTNRETLRLNVTLTYKYWIMEEAGAGITEEMQRALDNRSPLSADNNRGGPIAPFESFGASTQSDSLFDFGIPGNIGGSLNKYGPGMGSSVSRSLALASRNLTGSAMQGASGLSGSFTDLGSNFVSWGAGLGSLGRNLTAITAPVSAIAGATSAVSNTLGSIDNTLNALGLGRPFSKVRTNLTSTSAALGAVAGLKGVPGHINTIGANFTAMGSQFKNVSESIKRVPGATTSLSNSLSRLGVNLERQGSNTSNGANNLQTYSDNYA